MYEIIDSSSLLTPATVEFNESIDFSLFVVLFVLGQWTQCIDWRQYCRRQEEQSNRFFGGYTEKWRENRTVHLQGLIHSGYISILID